MKKNRLTLVVFLCLFSFSFQSCDLLIKAVFDGIHTAIVKVTVSYGWRCENNVLEVYGTLTNISEYEKSVVTIEIEHTVSDGPTELTSRQLSGSMMPNEEIDFSVSIEVEGEVTSVSCRVSEAY